MNRPDESLRRRVAGLLLTVAAGLAPAPNAMQGSTSASEPAAGPDRPALALPPDTLRWEDPDRGWRVRLGGRIHLDFATFRDDLTQFEDDWTFRRLRGTLVGRWGDFGVRFDRDVGGVFEGWRAFYLRRYGPGRMQWTLGDQLVPLGLDENTSSNALPFLERSQANALTAGNLVGLTLSTRGDSWGLTVGGFGDPLDTVPKRRSEGRSVAARATWAPVRDEQTLVHFGISGELREVDSGARYRLRARPEVRLTDQRLIDTRSLLGVESTSTLGVETILRRGPWTLSGELLRTNVEREQDEFEFQGWMVQVSRRLSGPAQRYSVRRGNLRRARVMDDASRPIDVSLRYSSLDLDDGLVRGGRGENATLGASWALSDNLRFVADAVLARADPNRNGDDEILRALQVRLQLML